jgi:hypothetical protein
MQTRSLLRRERNPEYGRAARTPTMRRARRRGNRRATWPAPRATRRSADEMGRERARSPRSLSCSHRVRLRSRWRRNRSTRVVPCAGSFFHRRGHRLHLADNNDGSARATTEACRAAGLAATERVHWNVYPWWLKAPCDGRVRRETELAHTFLVELLERLDEVASVVLIGGRALKAWNKVFRTGPPREDLYVGHGPHPSFGWWSKPYGTDGVSAETSSSMSYARRGRTP